MTDLRKAAEMALEALGSDSISFKLEARVALRQALAQPVDAVNISQEHVDETAKREHEPVWSDIVSDGGLDPRNAFDIAPPKQEWDGPTDEEYENFCSLIQREEAKLKERNGG